MKRLFATLVMLSGAIVVNAQRTSTTLLQKSLLTNTNKPAGNVCTCNPNQLTLLKSKPNAELFGKMTKLTADTVDYKPSTVTVYENVSVNQLLNTTAAINPDRMPIAKPANTDPRMPIVQTDRTAYTMPIVGKTQPRVYYPTVSPKRLWMALKFALSVK
ncbi:hypothetical protein HK413_08335 [Mucilaginibacter sp. S1162]|uniref:Uncharacterized protein n=1 Tax=Mucilaginibacter humi TaxID=2732510 RepID=A0ABX1W1U1_9SPHI|nr:hypothetical protein [Mucilaginibacter humi]NNU34153.1 hypothetical protein [Mucilaginibacter humi]